MTTSDDPLANVTARADRTRDTRATYNDERNGLIAAIHLASDAGHGANEIARSASGGLSRPIVLDAIKANRALPKIAQALTDAAVPVTTGFPDPARRDPIVWLSAKTDVRMLIRWGDEPDPDRSDESDEDLARAAEKALKAAGYVVRGDPNRGWARVEDLDASIAQAVAVAEGRS